MPHTLMSHVFVLENDQEFRRVGKKTRNQLRWLASFYEHVRRPLPRLEYAQCHRVLPLEGESGVGRLHPVEPVGQRVQVRRDLGVGHEVVEVGQRVDLSAGQPDEERDKDENGAWETHAHFFGSVDDDLSTVVALREKKILKLPPVNEPSDLLQHAHKITRNNKCFNDLGRSKLLE